MSWYRWQGQDLIINLRVQPRGGRTGFGEPYGEALKVRLKAAPVDGRANDELLRFVADSFGVRRDAVVLLRGRQSRSKQLRIQQPSRLPLDIAPG